jgi:hypothetical protein
MLIYSARSAHTPYYTVLSESRCAVYRRCWKWCPRASIQAWTRLISFANTFCESVCEMFLMQFLLIKRAWSHDTLQILLLPREVDSASPTAQHYHLWPVRLYYIYPHYLIEGIIFGKFGWTQNVFLCFVQFLSETFLILRKIQRAVILNIHRYSFKSTRCSCQILIKLEVKASYSYRNDGQTERERDTNITKLIFVFRNFVNAGNKSLTSRTIHFRDQPLLCVCVLVNNRLWLEGV